MPGGDELAGGGGEADAGALVAGGDADVRRFGERPDDRHVIGRQRAQAGVDAQCAGVAQDREEARGAAGDRARDGDLHLAVEADVLAARAQQRRAARCGLHDHRDLQFGVVGLDRGDVARLAQLAVEDHRGALEHHDLALARRDRDRQPGGRQQLGGPDAGGDHHRARGHPARAGLDAGRAPVGAAQELVHPLVGDELRTARDGRADQRGGGEPRLELRVARVQDAARQVVRRVRLLAPQRVGVQHLAGDAQPGEHPCALGGRGLLVLGLGDHDAALAVVLEVVGQLGRERLPQLGRAQRERQLTLELLVPGQHVALAGAGAARGDIRAVVEPDAHAGGGELVRAGRAHDARAHHDHVDTAACGHRFTLGTGGARNHHPNVQDRGGRLRGMSKDACASDNGRIRHGRGFDKLTLRAPAGRADTARQGDPGSTRGVCAYQR